ncbi:uncharacterized protein EDB91DRAFT_1153145 [Suillus paluster]|uniref:uncharacterized protein n=1 Tax=Suillus paluster TaxID=48578 RepID=UPI001B872DF8|nr:uncharacterized protein EDB91DRAFT_1153145 [Suillus paluster]KAG1731817.1 hypothetical protein EDB91DRAFT_1153145 [Suillus paluster]
MCCTTYTRYPALLLSLMRCHLLWARLSPTFTSRSWLCTGSFCQLWVCRYMWRPNSISTSEAQGYRDLGNNTMRSTAP